MKHRQIDERQLQKMLQALPDREVPDDLADRIMAEINAPRQKAGHFLRRLCSVSLTFRVQPLRLAGALCSLAFAFWLGLIIGGHPDGGGNDMTSAVSPLPVIPENAEANHMMGRGLLTGGQPEQALQFLRQASLIAPQNPDYALWEGVALGRKSNKEHEREIYRRIIRQYPDYLPARIYLGHNLLETGEPEEALAVYNEVLALHPGEETALYNRALACRVLGNPEEEAAAWKEYLQLNRYGKWAYRAVAHLNALGDFTYRSYQIGFRKIILSQDLLFNMDSDAGQMETDFLTTAFIQSAGKVLHLVVFQTGDADLAEKTAVRLQSRMDRVVGAYPDKEVHVSWFGKPEDMLLPSGRQYQLPRGLLIFSQPNTRQEGGKTI